MKQRPKQHKVNNSKNKRVVTLRLFFTTQISVDCNKKNASATP